MLVFVLFCFFSVIVSWQWCNIKLFFAHHASLFYETSDIIKYLNICHDHSTEANVVIASDSLSKEHNTSDTS